MLTAVVLAHNEEQNLVACLNCLQWCDRIVVVDHQSSDQTAPLAQKFPQVTLLKMKSNDFSRLRGEALKNVQTPWVIYIDADERVTPSLAAEIKATINNAEDAVAALVLTRQNICYGYPLSHGGWEKDRVERIFRVKNFTGYSGKIHESPVYTGQTKTLNSKLIHLTHRSCVDNLYKTAAWTPMEADLLAAAGGKKVTPGLILRKGWMEFYRRYFRWRGHKDGTVGFVESLTQAINRCLVYIQVWERQQKPDAPTRYAREEEKIATAWQKARA